MKLAIIGSSGSGKTTLASAISQKTKIPMYSLDKICYLSITNHKKVKEIPKAEREQMLKTILKKDKWIIEGIYYGPWTHSCFASADLTLFLACNRYKRALRILSRHIKRVAGLYDGEQETLKHLLWVIKYNHNMDCVYQDSIQEIESISKKFEIIKGFKDAQKLLKSVYDI
jgi:adenylate kinase family enzyme